MPFAQLLLHWLNFVAPAVVVAVLLVGATTVWWRRTPAMLPWYSAMLVQGLLGVLVLALGLVLTGHDGRMATYGVMVVAMASCQWLLGHGWRR